jgi:NADP-dependent 3-hydroxy acid dehydrogenase YdfG
MKQVIVITGASSGFGALAARRLVSVVGSAIVTMVWRGAARKAQGFHRRAI